MMKVLVVVDMQNDFIDGALGSSEAQAIVPNVVEKIRKANHDGDIVLFTKDTHYSMSYADSLEGEKLPIVHCIKNSDGWCINKKVRSEWLGGNHINISKAGFLENNTVEKNTFGSFILSTFIRDIRFGIESVELCGLDTDICVVSNALLIRAACPDMPIIVDASCCAGTTPENHKAALAVMKSCQIDVIGE